MFRNITTNYHRTLTYVVSSIWRSHMIRRWCVVIFQWRFCCFFKRFVSSDISLFHFLHMWKTSSRLLHVLYCTLLYNSRSHRQFLVLGGSFSVRNWWFSSHRKSRFSDGGQLVEGGLWVWVEDGGSRAGLCERKWSGWQSARPSPWGRDPLFTSVSSVVITV